MAHDTKFQVNVRANIGTQKKCCSEHNKNNGQYEYGFYDHSYRWLCYKMFCQHCVAVNLFQDAAERIKQQNADKTFELHYLNQGFLDSQPEFINEELIQNFLIM